MSSISNKSPSQGTRGRVRLAPDVRVAEIEVAARAELAEKGYERFVPSDVARRCGVSEATIYRYFPTKRDLLIKVAEDWFAEVLEIEPEVEKHRDVQSRLRHVIWWSLSTIRREPALTRFVLMDLRPDPAYRSMRIFELNRRFTSTVVAIVRDAVAVGTFRAGVAPEVVRDMIYGAIEHRTWSYLRGDGDFDVDETADGIASVILRGVFNEPLSDAAVLAPVVARLEKDADSLREEIRRLRKLTEKDSKA